ncbi:MAG: Hpt domain-containing protein [Nitrospinota bacterium]
MPTLERLRERYFQSVREKLEALELWLQSAQREAERAEALRELLRTFHSLAGSGATYGFPQISQAGRRGEDYVKECIDTGGALPPHALRRVATYVEGLEAAFADAVSTHEGGGIAAPPPLPAPENGS